MRNPELTGQLRKTLERLYKRERRRYGIVMDKMEEILRCEDIDHYKNLRAPLQHLKRVHIDGSFVLTFSYTKEDDTVTFYELDHHDNIYR